jgi:Uma2 family endonuclease
VARFAGIDPGYDVEGYFGLVESGVLAASDHVELLEGVIVAAPPQAPLHAAVIMCVDAALRRVIASDTSVRVQLPFVAGPRSVPEPDFAVVPGSAADYLREHPRRALLVVEVSDRSLAQDRLSKSRIYAAAGVPEYWIVNVRERCLEIRLEPDRVRRVYSVEKRAVPGEDVLIRSIDSRLAVADLFPGY